MTDEENMPVVGMREPCPCGSGKRYKNCHAGERAAAASAFVNRPFEGLACEGQLVMMAEFLASATADLPLARKQSIVPAGVTVTVATILPNGIRGIRASDEQLFLGLQNTFNSGDRSRDAVDALEALADAEPKDFIDSQSQVPAGARLQDVVDAGALLDVATHADFGWWKKEKASAGFKVDDLEDLNSSVVLADPVPAVPAAYVMHLSGRPQVRMALPYSEDAATDAWARLAAAREESLGEGTRLVGNFRAHGILVPVWDIPAADAAAVADSVRAFAQRFGEAAAETGDLSGEQRRARASVVAKFVTIRK